MSALDQYEYFNHFLSLATDKSRHGAKLEFKHGLRTGEYVYVTHKPDLRGRIEDVVIKHPNPRGSCQPFAKFLVRLDDGSFIEEHAEYLAKAKPPTPKLV